MGIPNEPFICPSLARGIRRAYLESLDRHWAIFRVREKSDALRNPHLHLRTHKGYMREIERIRSRLMPRFLSISDMRVAAVKAIKGMDAEDVRRLDVIIPAEHGIFLGCFDPEARNLVLTTFVDSAKLWEEEVHALDQLNQLGEERLALSALDLLAEGWMAHDDTHVSERLIDIWKTFGWVIREREERPGKMDQAWSARTEEGEKDVLDA